MGGFYFGVGGAMIWLFTCAGVILLLCLAPWRLTFAAAWRVDGSIDGELRLWHIRIKRIPDLLMSASRVNRTAAAPGRGKRVYFDRMRLVHHLANCCWFTIEPNCLFWDPASIWSSDGWLKAAPLPVNVAVRPWPMRHNMIAVVRATARIRPLVLAIGLLWRCRSVPKLVSSRRTYHGEAYTMGKVEQILGDVERMISTKTVIGEPMTTGGITIIPITSVSFGLGTGEKGEDKGQADGVATGFRVSPVAVLVIRDGDVSVLPINGTANPERLIGMLPDLWEKMKGKKEKSEVRQTAGASATAPDAES